MLLKRLTISTQENVTLSKWNTIDDSGNKNDNTSQIVERVENKQNDEEKKCRATFYPGGGRGSGSGSGSRARITRPSGGPFSPSLAVCFCKPGSALRMKEYPSHAAGAGPQGWGPYGGSPHATPGACLPRGPCCVMLVLRW